MSRRPGAVVLRLLAIVLLDGLALMLAAWLLPGFDLAAPATAFLLAAVIGVLNALVWPLLVRLVLPLTVLTLGLLPLFLNGLIVVVAASLVPDVTVSDIWTAVLVVLVVTTVTLTVTAVFSLDDDEYFYRRTMKRASREVAASEVSSVPGVLFLQIDGLGHDVVRRAVRNGDVPQMAGWLAEGSHRLVGWETDWSSQTGASQAGILLGSNHDMPAFRWYEKETGALMVSNRPRCAREIEDRRSSGDGLLRGDGASRGNVFTGGAADAVLTMSVAGRRHGRIGGGYLAYFSSPYNTSRTALLTFSEVFRERRQARHQRRRDVRPRTHRGGAYPLLRAFTTVVSQEVTVATLIGDMYAGRSVIYADFLGYDEVAHHSGVERYESLECLRRLDREIGRLRRVAAGAPRPYHVVVLSDHGQSQGATFRDRFGSSLGQVVSRAMGDGARVDDRTGPAPAGEESWGYAGGAAAELASGEGTVAAALRRMTKERRREGDVVLGPEVEAAEAPASESDAMVLGSGNCGLVYLLAEPGRATLESISARYPDLVPSLVDHPGIGFVLVRSEEAGPVVLGRDGAHFLATGEVRGADPLTPFGPRAAQHVARTDSYPHCADLMVNSLWDPQTEEVAAFEDLVGSHGGMGGEQSRPFLLFPAELPVPDGDIVGAEQVHRVLCGWLAHLGHPAYAVPRPTPEPSPSPDAAHSPTDLATGATS